MSEQSKQQWYIRIGRKVYGPHSASTVRRAAREGKIGPTTKLRRGETGRWVEAGTVAGLSFDEIEVEFAAMTTVGSVGPEKSATLPRGGTMETGWRTEARKELAATYGSKRDEDIEHALENRPEASGLMPSEIAQEITPPTGTWEPIGQRTPAGCCPVTGKAGLSDEVVIAEHCPFVQSRYSVVRVSSHGATIHRRNRGRFWKLYDALMRFPYASIPFIGGNLQLFVIACAWLCFPLCAAIDLLQFRHPLGRGNVRMGMEGLLVRREI